MTCHAANKRRIHGRVTGEWRIPIVFKKTYKKGKKKGKKGKKDSNIRHLKSVLPGLIHVGYFLSSSAFSTGIRYSELASTIITCISDQDAWVWKTLRRNVVSHIQYCRRQTPLVNILGINCYNLKLSFRDRLWYAIVCTLKRKRIY